MAVAVGAVSAPDPASAKLAGPVGSPPLSTVARVLVRVVAGDAVVVVNAAMVVPSSVWLAVASMPDPASADEAAAAGSPPRVTAASL